MSNHELRTKNYVTNSFEKNKKQGMYIHLFLKVLSL